MVFFEENYTKRKENNSAKYAGNYYIN